MVLGAGEWHGIGLAKITSSIHGLATQLFGSYVTNCTVPTRALELIADAAPRHEPCVPVEEAGERRVLSQ
jgi:hypothetical protein